MRYFNHFETTCLFLFKKLSAHEVFKMLPYATRVAAAAENLNLKERTSTTRSALKVMRAAQPYVTLKIPYTFDFFQTSVALAEISDWVLAPFLPASLRTFVQRK